MVHKNILYSTCHTWGEIMRTIATIQEYRLSCNNSSSRTCKPPENYIKHFYNFHYTTDNINAIHRFNIDLYTNHTGLSNMNIQKDKQIEVFTEY